MFDDLQKYLEKLIHGLERSMEVVTEAMPLLVRQEFITRARRQLDSSFEEYRNSLDIHFESNSVLVVELDPASWLANAVETGREPWNMKEQFLKSPKARRSSKGFRFMRIAIPKDTKGGQASDRAESMDLQAKIRTALERPQFGPAKIRPSRDGTIAITEKVGGAVSGLYRVRRFASMADYKGGGYARATQYVMFRTVSENPAAVGKWDHPGIRGVHIFQQVDAWADTILPHIVEKMIDDTIKKALES